MADYRIETPEAVQVQYQLAGIGSRGLALLLDSLITGVCLVAIIIGLIVLASWIPRTSNVALVLGFTLVFLLQYGYFVVFETLWNGQTPGKRAMGLRVVKTNGYAIGFAEAFVRNLIRIVDSLGSYAVGVIVMFVSPQSRRLGDYAAGTVVVRERPRVRVTSLESPHVEGAPRGTVDAEELDWDLAVLAASDVTLMEDYLRRQSTLTPQARAALGSRIAGGVARRIGAREPLDPARFMQRVLFLAREE